MGSAPCLVLPEEQLRPLQVLPEEQLRALPLEALEELQRRHEQSYDDTSAPDFTSTADIAPAFPNDLTRGNRKNSQTYDIFRNHPTPNSAECLLPRFLVLY